MASAKKSDGPAPSKMTFEAAITELEALIERIEEGEIGLEDTLAARRRGAALIQRCRAVLDCAEQELREVAGDQVDAGGADAPGEGDEHDDA